MTFAQIVTRVKERMNLTSSEAEARIGRFVNDRYARITSSLGINTALRTSATAATVSGNPRVTFSIEKIERMYCTGTSRRMLEEISYDEWRNNFVNLNRSGSPQLYAIENPGASSVTVVLDPVPDAVETLSVDGLTNASELSGSSVPAFPADFHDVLVFGAMADEYAKLEKQGLATQYETQYEARLSDLRYFLAKSSYLSQKQGNATRTKRWSPRIV